MFSKPSGLVLHLLGLLDQKIRDWEFYYWHRTRWRIVCFVSVSVIFTLSQFTNGFWLDTLVLVSGLVIVFSWLPENERDFREFESY